MGSDGVTPSQSSKRPLSSDCRLQFACMKSESVVIANQQVAVSTFSFLAHTARQASKVSSARSGCPELFGGRPFYGEIGDED